ncbi:hypothetical protein P154DRAFT_618817 [Amniculicola lignicola CBS 123094]|uniref:Uncharacterized protein n=1 Tax=Amniculicola lignicola CBS 123094 TaxID=1392246 RepID=A0A6A5WJL3_9PLEO|nr:hypothetical protein P154DRAFT_618817 [Amniculicola lignicola CBS 123094]
MSDTESSKAMVFFFDEDLSVLDRAGCIKLLQVSPFATQLGEGQPAVFCIPSEKRKRKIYKFNAKPMGFKIGVTDVLAWAILETWADLRRSMPLWAMQGRRFEAQQKLLTADQETSWDTHWLEDEPQRLEDCYRPHSSSALDIDDWDMPNPIIARIKSYCNDF